MEHKMISMKEHFLFHSCYGNISILQIQYLNESSFARKVFQPIVCKKTHCLLKVWQYFSISTQEEFYIYIYTVIPTPNYLRITSKAWILQGKFKGQSSSLKNTLQMLEKCKLAKNTWVDETAYWIYIQ